MVQDMKQQDNGESKKKERHIVTWTQEVLLLSSYVCIFFLIFCLLFNLFHLVSSHIGFVNFRRMIY